MANQTKDRRNSVKRGTIAALLLFLGVAVVGGTYARYTSSGTGGGELEVAKWAAAINGTDITAANAEFNVKFNEVTNNDVVDGKIAPASSVYADFIIDPTDSEVAVDYEFTIDDIEAPTGKTMPQDLAVEKVVPVTNATISGTGTNLTVTGGTEGTALVADASGKYSGTIALSDQDTALAASDRVVIRVYVKWTNNEANNANHTTAGTEAQTLTMTVNGTMKQHITAS